MRFDFPEDQVAIIKLVIETALKNQAFSYACIIDNPTTYEYMYEDDAEIFEFKFSYEMVGSDTTFHFECTRTNEKKSASSLLELLGKVFQNI